MFQRAIRKASKYLIYATMLVVGHLASNTDIEPQDRRKFFLSIISHIDIYEKIHVQFNQ